MTPAGRTQVTRVFTNSSVNALEVDKLLRFNVLQAKLKVDRALAFCNVTTTKSFASVVAGKGDRGYRTSSHKESARRSKVFNTNAVPFSLGKRVHKNNSFKAHTNVDGGAAGVQLQDSIPTGEAVKVHHCRLLFESNLVSDLMDLDGLSDDQLPVSKVTPMANTSATASNNQRVDVCDDREGLNLVNGQQSTLTAYTDFFNSTQQLGSSFGCIPLTPTLLYQGTQKIWKNVPEVLQAYRMI